MLSKDLSESQVHALFMLAEYATYLTPEQLEHYRYMVAVGSEQEVVCDVARIAKFA